MKLHTLDLIIIVAYFVTVILVGLWVSRRGVKDLDSYFLGGKKLPWYMLGVSDASGMFDISGTMWLVSVLFLYGLKSIWLPWVWPTFNQIFLMMFMSAWLRRSNVLTGAQWMQTRFGNDRGGTLAHLSVVFFALVNVIGLLAYAFKGIGKFASGLLPWHFTTATTGIFTDDNIYAMILMGLTSLYAIKGGMVSVVITEVMQFTILTLTALTIGIIAIIKVSPDMIAHKIPDGWMNPFFGRTLNLNWEGILNTANTSLKEQGNEWFSIIFGLMFFKGVLASLAGPAPNYDMQRILATRNPREASLMNGMVTLVLMFPRYMMIAGITVLALAFCMPELNAQAKPDFEKILPNVLQYIPTGVVGFLLAGLAAAFMSNFAATLNAAPAYVVNDIYKRFINANAGGKKEVALSRIVALLFLAIGICFGIFSTSITNVMMWLVGGLYGGYVLANVLKWYWWRFNGYGYFWGMMAGILSAMFVPMALQHFLDQRSPSLSASDFTDLPRFASAINSPGTNGVSLYLQSQLTPATRESLSRYQGGSDAILSIALAEDLNRITQNGSIYQSNRFTGIILSGRTEDLAKKKNPQAHDLLLLNRMLLEDSYSMAIESRFRFSPNALYTFPFILFLSVIGCFAGTLLTKPEDDAILKKFYKTVNPWGCWGPIRAKVMAEDPNFKPNHSFVHDMTNVAVGIVWQLCLVALPIFIVLRQWHWVGGIAALLVATSVYMKFNWYDKLEKA
jgi:SSS family solute:Na+ symporter